jgi:hypothetical protein
MSKRYLRKGGWWVDDSDVVCVRVTVKAVVLNAAKSYGICILVAGDNDGEGGDLVEN